MSFMPGLSIGQPQPSHSGPYEMCKSITSRQASAASRHRKTTLKLPVILTLIGCLITPNSQAENCYRKSVDATWPHHTFNFAVWADPDHSRAVLVDSLFKRSLDLELSPDPQSGVVIVQPELSTNYRSPDLFSQASSVDDVNFLEEFLIGVKPAVGGHIGLNISSSNGLPTSMRWYDTSLRRRGGSTRLESRVGIDGELIVDNRVMSMWTWQPVADRIFAYGALGIAGRLDVFREGFYITHLQAPSRNNGTPVGRMILDLPGHRPYSFHHNYIAVDGDLVYFLEVSAHLSLRYYDMRSDKSGRLENFPHENSPIPYPSLSASWDTDKSLPVGLYYRKGFLYALWRQSREDGQGSAWNVIKLQPNLEKGKVETRGEAWLPIAGSEEGDQDVRHLYILPADDFWLILEFMIQGGPHRLQAVLTIPATWITEPHTSQLAERTPKRMTCLSIP